MACCFPAHAPDGSYFHAISAASGESFDGDGDKHTRDESYH